MSLELEIDVPESRTVTLPDSVPVGRVRVVVRDDTPEPPVTTFEVNFPVARLPVVGNEAYQREYEAFQTMLPELLKTHRGQYVAVHGGRVVAEGADDATVTAEAYARVGYTELHVGEVTEAPRVLRMPSFRVLRGGGA